MGRAGQGERDHYVAAGERLQHATGRRAGRIHHDRLAALVTEGPTHPGPQEPEVVVDLGRGSDRRAARRGGVLLLDGHRGRHAVQPVHGRLGHPLQELLGVRREGLDVAPLAFGIEGVEGERAFAGSRRAGHHREGAARNLDGDAFEVVLAGVLQDHGVGRHTEA
jgi:hypothetical protein